MGMERVIVYLGRIVADVRKSGWVWMILELGIDLTVHIVRAEGRKVPNYCR
jgi:hypothetical protein